MKFNYDRLSAITYAKDWCKNGGSSDYPDLTPTFGNNISFLYQCLFNGGYFWEGSNYLDTFSTNLYPVIARMTNFFSALIEEVKAEVVITEDTSLLTKLKTADIVLVNKNNGGSVGLIAEVFPSSRSFFATSPVIYGQQDLPIGDRYAFCFIPDLGDN